MPKENWKWKLKRRIEQGAIKVNVNGEEILLKKSKILPFKWSPRQWTEIHPPINEYGKINWMNFLFGGKTNLIKLIMILAVIGMLLLGLVEIFNSDCVQWCSNNPNLVNQSGIIMPTCPAN